jgi:UDP-N-acetyl-alpha-D-muramoyl-L-alanyl-L-glutamate epimerase
MSKQDNQDKFINLRKNYPYFAYEDYDIAADQNNIILSFHFNLAGKYSFHPQTIIPVKPFFRDFSAEDLTKDPFFRNLVFHLGMIEAISYWKAVCPPELIIKPHSLGPEQVSWWKNLYFKGLGEFFYLNGIQAGSDDFLSITSTGTPLHQASLFDGHEEYLVPVGGGKDSTVSLEKLKDHAHCIPFIINPRNASLDTTLVAGYKEEEILIFRRSIDQQLLKLNEQGFLNGHTPFSAMLAFASLIGARLSGVKNIALSNESSANEATIQGTDINHQYSKTIDFERDFRYYVKTWLSPDLNYFSFLRPLSELQIAFLFSRMPRYFNVFKSCNAGSNQDIWCCNCPKCLFTYIILSPFVDESELTRIFGEDLLNKASLERPFLEMTGLLPEKPFECIGTVHEINSCLANYISRHGKKTMPYLVNLFFHSGLYSTYQAMSDFPGFSGLNRENFVNAELIHLLTNSLHVG